MNLVVVARRPELAERCAATIQALTGRHPSRTIVIQSADPDGPSWLDARVEAHCILPREDAPETCAETIHLTAGGEAGRHLAAIVDAADHPRPAGHGLVAGRAAARGRARRGTCSRRADRLVVDGSTWSGDGLGRLRELADARRDDPPGDQRLRARPPVALAGGDRLDLRRPGLPALPALAAPDRGDLRDARRDRRARVDEPRQADLPRRLARVPPRACTSSSRSPPVGEPALGPRRRRRSAHRCRPTGSGAGSAATLSDGRAEVAVVVRPVVSPMPRGHDPARRAPRASGAAPSCGPT